MVVIGNPPYSKGQDSQNDDNQNVKYETLDARIAGHVRGTVHRDEQELALRLLHPRHPLGLRPHQGRGHRRLRLQRRLHRRQHRGRAAQVAGPRVRRHLLLQPARQPAHRWRAITQGRRKDLRLRKPEHRRHPAPREGSEGPSQRGLRAALPRHRRLPQPRGQAPHPQRPGSGIGPLGGDHSERRRRLDQPARPAVRRIPADRREGQEARGSRSSRSTPVAWRRAGTPGSTASRSQRLTENVESMIDFYNEQVPQFAKHCQSRRYREVQHIGCGGIHRLRSQKISWNRDRQVNVARGVATPSTQNA